MKFLEIDQESVYISVRTKRNLFACRITENKGFIHGKLEDRKRTKNVQKTRPQGGSYKGRSIKDTSQFSTGSRLHLDELKGRNIQHKLQDNDQILSFSARVIEVDPEVSILYEGDQDYYVWTREEIIQDIENGDLTVI